MLLMDPSLRPPRSRSFRHTAVDPSLKVGKQLVSRLGIVVFTSDGSLKDMPLEVLIPFALCFRAQVRLEVISSIVRPLNVFVAPFEGAEILSLVGVHAHVAL